MFLLAKFPTRTSYERAHIQERAALQWEIRKLKERSSLLEAEKRELLAKRASYGAQPIPMELRDALDANEASLEAHQYLIANQYAEFDRINKAYDRRLPELRKLWGTVPP